MTGRMIVEHLLLALSQPPWSGRFMLLLRMVLGGLFMLVLMLLWLRRHQARLQGRREYRDGCGPVLLAGLGLLLLCSQDRGGVDHVFQWADRILMNGPVPEKEATVRQECGYTVQPAPADDVPGQPDSPQREGGQ